MQLVRIDAFLFWHSCTVCSFNRCCQCTVCWYNRSCQFLL